MAVINLLVQSRAFFNITPRTGEFEPQGGYPIFITKWIEDFTEDELSSQASIVEALKQALVFTCVQQGLVVADQKFQIVISTQFAQDPAFFEGIFTTLPETAFVVMIDFQSQVAGFLPNPN